MTVKISPEDRKQYLRDKISQLNVPPQEVSEASFVSIDLINQFLFGTQLIDDKTWVQLGLGLSRLSKKLGVPTEKEEKNGATSNRRVSRTAIIKQVEDLDFFKE